MRFTEERLEQAIIELLEEERLGAGVRLGSQGQGWGQVFA
jgi:hypothetical protein